ncbi:uncharacterized protein LOC115689847 isoform X2 [Syzygium oleosum]|uniref:uncharacterized protein LOC115689847 isoform X2 n=1 Tax=Syzygium oleosum TaxID=219896 RepID=UPI0024B90A32|nr:uncharacterized protein LOC115689847 isoform X2 [Syzygium oleosum]
MAMEVAVSTNFGGCPRRYSVVNHRQRPASTAKGFGQNSIVPATRIRRSCRVLAANNPKSDDKGSSFGESYASQSKALKEFSWPFGDSKCSPFPLTLRLDDPCMQEDLNYLWKLGAGSIAGAALIKYGSILFPEITRPNIIEALGMISTPVVVAVLLLIKQSRAEQ